MRATEPGTDQTLGLALFNLRSGRLCLGESGDPTLDAPFIEHNAPLTIAGAQTAAIRAALLDAAWRVPGARRLVLGGTPPDLVPDAGGVVLRQQIRTAPRVDLDAIRAGPSPGDYLAALSPNTRYQIRRAMRRQQARHHGRPLRAEAATTEAQALAWLHAMIALHQDTWRRRGQPGAFAEPFVRRFHEELVRRALAAGMLQLLRIAPDGGGPPLGYLYNFRVRGWVHAYQSGFDYASADAQDKPGLVCHAIAIQQALEAGDSVYDFLAGDDRYKRSLANAEVPLVWTELVPRWSPLGLAARLRRGLGLG